MASIEDANLGLNIALIIITYRQTVSRNLLVNTIVAYLVLFCFVLFLTSLLLSIVTSIHLFLRSKAQLRESVILFSLVSCRSGTLCREFITIV